ncbi:type V CRISPR-associated protein Cas12b [Akkermansiaceae bacterium]|nr:type V CRISPR-associated protein Cas12b [Akkermansiaceae bacterium]
MNRIYQGRAKSLEIIDSEGNTHTSTIGDPLSCPLWKHHSIFQDAVNYYLLALGSLADKSSPSRVIRDLRVRLDASWEKHPRNQSPLSGLRASLRRTFPALPTNATIGEGFKAILTGNEAPENVRMVSLTLLLSKCGGDAAIQQGGRGYFPRFCDPKTNPTWDYSASSLESTSGSDTLANVLHSEPSQAELESIAAIMDLSWAGVKLQPGKFYKGNDAKARLHEAISHLLSMLENPSKRLTEALENLGVEPATQLSAYRDAIATLPDEISIPKNRKAAKDLTFSAITFIHFPSELTRRFLRLGIKAPKATKVSAKKDDESLFRSLGDDPIKLARGNRGYVFPAFTSLPIWNPASEGLPVWKEFDIAAFKEALKALNQFNLKTIEREEKLHRAIHERDFLLWRTDEAPKSGDEDTEVAAPSRYGKSREDWEAKWKLITDLETELGRNLNEGEWQISTGSVRGLRDVIELWEKEKFTASTEELEKVVKKFQADDKNKREIGSVQLFLLLCTETYRPLWQTGKKVSDDEDEQEKSAQSIAIFRAAIQIHRLEREIERFRLPIKLTPAEPDLSRRLFMFSDLGDKLAKVKLGEIPGEGDAPSRHFVETAIAFQTGTHLKETRVRIFYSAPRLRRDELLGGAESKWLQPMTAALGLPAPEKAAAFDSAVSLMPDRDADGKIRHLLNFPVSLDAEPLHQFLGKSALWKNQFNGTKDKSIHLHWPGTERDATKKNRWWENPRIVEHGFTILSNDLGQRNAGAWALLKVTCHQANTNKPVIPIGSDGIREWFATVIDSGMYRLPGEDLKIQNKGKWEREKSGKTGRMPSPEEYIAAISLAQKLDIEKATEWLRPHGDLSLPELNDKLLRIANRRLSRLAAYHRWSCFKAHEIQDPEKRKKVIEGQVAELAHYEDEKVKALIPLLTETTIPDFRNASADLFAALRHELQTHLENLANSVAPLRGKIWQWIDRGGESPYGNLTPVPFMDATPKIRGQRGLSMSRLEQLEDLRRLFLRYNRSLDKVAHVPANFGREDQGRESGEPCQNLLDKIDRMKEQRVNQTAHLILAKALGVSLKAHSIPEAERSLRDIHGEYEKSPGREPVDFIVMEDLSRYLSSQGRAPSENSRLMKWAHRAVRDKLKMLAEEPFGIPVLEIAPAYSSRFHFRNGQPGARLKELHQLEPYQKTSLEKTTQPAGKADRIRALAAKDILEQFEIISKENSARIASGKKPRTLYFPVAGGPLFLAARDGNPIQSDVNAAINLGLRAVAAPSCIAIHRRVRAKMEKGNYIAVQKNAREKAAFKDAGKIEITSVISKKFAKSASPNFFYEPDGLVRPDGNLLDDRASLKGQPLVSGLALWSAVNQAIYARCAALNQRRLEAWGLSDEIPI